MGKIHEVSIVSSNKLRTITRPCGLFNPDFSHHVVVKIGFSSPSGSSSEIFVIQSYSHYIHSLRRCRHLVSVLSKNALSSSRHRKSALIIGFECIEGL